MKPICREDYIGLVRQVLSCFKEQRDKFILIRKARLEYIYLDYLNKNFVETFHNEHSDRESELLPYVYAGMLFNVSMKWLDDGCRQPAEDVAEIIVDAIYFQN